jgi:hypothetical protein
MGFLGWVLWVFRQVFQWPDLSLFFFLFAGKVAGGGWWVAAFG